MACDVSLDPKPEVSILPASSFFLILNGKPGSGKTNMLLNLLLRKSLYGRKFDKIFFFSPSQRTFSENYLNGLPKSQRFDTFNIPDLMSAIESIEDSGKKVLFVFDDVVNDLDTAKNQSALLRLLYNRRHLTGKGGFTSVIITSQVYNRIPLRIRKVATHTIFFPTGSEKEKMSIYDELVGGMNYADFDSILKRSWGADEHAFIFMDILRQKFYRNFDTEISPLQSSELDDDNNSSDREYRG